MCIPLPRRIAIPSGDHSGTGSMSPMLKGPVPESNREPRKGKGRRKPSVSGPCRGSMRLPSATGISPGMREGPTHKDRARTADFTRPASKGGGGRKSSLKPSPHSHFTTQTRLMSTPAPFPPLLNGFKASRGSVLPVRVPFRPQFGGHRPQLRVRQVNGFVSRPAVDVRIVPVPLFTHTLRPLPPSPVGPSSRASSAFRPSTAG